MQALGLFVRIQTNWKDDNALIILLILQLLILVMSAFQANSKSRLALNLAVQLFNIIVAVRLLSTAVIMLLLRELHFICT